MEAVAGPYSFLRHLDARPLLETNATAGQQSSPAFTCNCYNGPAKSSLTRKLCFASPSGAWEVFSPASAGWASGEDWPDAPVRDWIRGVEKRFKVGTIRV